MLHAHYGGSSRDCDGSYDHGYDIAAREDESEGDFEHRIWASCFRAPDVLGEPVAVTVDFDEQGRLTMGYHRYTDEGYESGEYTICASDDYEETYSGFRDHTAESMGY